MIGTPLISSPWLTKSTRPSLAPSLRTTADDDEGEEGEDETGNILESLSDEVRARLPGSVDELLRLVGGEFMDNVVARRRSTMGVRTKDQYPGVPGECPFRSSCTLYSVASSYSCRLCYRNGRRLPSISVL